MTGLILNIDDDRLPPSSPWRTREEERAQTPVFTLDDGSPVYEVWFWRHNRWFCMTREHQPSYAAAGVIVFFGIEQLKGWLAHIEAHPRAS